MKTTNPAKVGSLEVDTTVDGVDVSAHAADLAAHMADYLQILRIGEYHMPGSIYRYNAGTAITANTLLTLPFFIPRPMTADRIAIFVQTAGAAGTKARLGIYNNGTNLYPGTLLLDAGEIVVDSTGLKAIIISQALSKGLYWLAFVSDGTPSLPNSTHWDTHILGWRADDITYPNFPWQKAFTYAALPNPFPSDATYGTCYWHITLRIASLD